MQSVSSRIWTRVAVSISYDDNDYTTGLGYYVKVLREFRKIFRRKRPALFKSGLWYFHQGNAPLHNTILVTNNLTKMGIKTVPQSPYSQNLASCDFWLLPKVRGCRYETIDEMKEAVTKVIGTLTKRTSIGPSRSCWNSTRALQSERITSKRTRVSCVVLSIKVPIRKSLETYLMILVYYVIAIKIIYRKMQVNLDMNEKEYSS